MSTTMPPEHDPSLLDLHLGRLTESQRTALLLRLAQDPKLAAENEAVSAIFRALGCLRDQRLHAPPGLQQRVCARVAAAGAPPRVVRPPHAAGRDEELRPERWFIRVRSLRDVVAVAAVLVLAVGIGIPSLLNVRERSRLMGCSSNLARLGQGLAAYANAYGNALPLSQWNQGRYSWRPVDTPGREWFPNRRHVYPLLRAGNVSAMTFICPSRRDVPMPSDQIRAHDDFLEARNVSYAYQNMAGVRPTISSNPDLPILADDNPLFDNGIPLFSGGMLGPRDPALANSNAHRGRGENILTLGGAVRFVQTPLSGIDGDNIWLLQGVDAYEGVEGPTSAADSHLLK